jgi:cytochrome c biogenesis protein CcdA
MKKIFFSILWFILWYQSTFAAESMTDLVKSDNFMDNIWFLAFLIPAAAGDSINPCAFAVMIILLTSILKQHKSRAKVIISGLMFILAIFISYVAMWLALFETLAWNFDPKYIQYTIWVVWILIWLANLKDYFWYGKYFRMEVPTSWRPKMKSLLKWVTSPMWAFFIGFLISLFLLPCTSGPYVVVTSYLSSNQISFDVAAIYILIYNVVFIIPMFIIMFMIAFGVKSVEEINELKELNVEKMHLITWIIMLLLWIYVILDASGIITQLFI